MFESAELGHSIDKKMYEKEVPRLREELLDVQHELMESKAFSTFIILNGVDGAGKSEVLKILNEWMDPRFIETNALGEPSDEERERPSMWRYWRAFPPKGKIGIFMTTWYSAPILDRVHERNGDSAFDQALERIVRLEKMLTDEGALMLKYWLHLSREGQRTRFKALEKDPHTAWRVTDRDWKNLKLYDKFKAVTERALRRTSTAEAPWTIVEGADECYRYLTVGKSVLEALRKKLKHPKPAKSVSTSPPSVPSLDNLSILQKLDMTQVLSKKSYNDQLEKNQGRLNLLTRHPDFKKINVVAVFEGNDAAGKGGAVRRVTGALDARIYRIVPIAAPTQEELAQPYLWRFWRHLPRKGRVAIFDRSWYGRVMVERVEGYCSEGDWMRAYSEINDFEEQMVLNGTVVLKFWLTITSEEQLTRFKDREATGFKRFKITEEDWRNREKWDQYGQAVCDMIERTSTEIAPWTLVEANDKRGARIKVLKTFCREIDKALKKVK